LETLNIRKKNLNVHDNILELKVYIESNLSLIQWLDEENWIKSMCIKYIMYIFPMAIGPHIYGSLHITKPKKNEKKKMLCSPIKISPFS
jgi:hypothetical protein